MNETATFTSDVTGIERLSRDLRTAVRNLGEQEARFLVDQYYLIQETRIRSANQVRSMGDEPILFLNYVFDQFVTLEKQVQYALDKYSLEHELGRWTRAVTGIGPVIASGLIAHLDIRVAPTSGRFLAFGGFDPGGKKWGKGEKRPWNAALKVLYWKLAESFVKMQGRESDFYGKIFAEKKAEYIAKNEAGGYADRAAEILIEKKWNKATVSYKAYIEGRFPDGHIHAMGRRWVIKIFLSHLHEVWYFQTFGILPPNPYAFAVLGHSSYIPVPYQEAIPNVEKYQELRAAVSLGN